MTAKEQVQELLTGKGYLEVSFIEGTVLKSARKPFFHHRVDYEVIARHGESLHPGEWSLQVNGSSWQEVLDKLTKLFLIQEEQYLKARATKKFTRGCVVCDARPTWTTEEYEAHIAHGGRGLEASDSIFRQGWDPDRLEASPEPF